MISTELCKVFFIVAYDDDRAITANQRSEETRITGNRFIDQGCDISFVPLVIPVNKTLSDIFSKEALQETLMRYPVGLN